MQLFINTNNLMKKFVGFLALNLVVGFACAQNIHKTITKPYVDRLIKTLSSNEMQGRMTFTPGIEKAATFIENEFKAIGLAPLPGQQSFRQTFYRYQITPKSTSVTIDGEAVPSNNIAVANNKAANTSFDHTTAWIKIDTTKDFISQYRNIMRSNKKQLVLVDGKFAGVFAQLKASLANSASIGEEDLAKEGKPVVLVLGKDTVANSFKVDLENTLTKTALFNVVGVLPGKSKAKELVVFSGHYDHMGIVSPKNGNSIMNGADDDASGTAAVIALAKHYKQTNSNQRTLIFTAFTAEEIGGFGARYFSKQLNPNDVTAMFNIEMIGKESKFGKNAAFITGYEKSDFGKILQKNLAGTPFSFHPDPYPEQNLFYRSDNATLASLGVPAHTISTDQIDTDKLYHSVDDEYETLDIDNIMATIKAIAKSATSIVAGKDTPSRIPPLKK